MKQKELLKVLVTSTALTSSTLLTRADTTVIAGARAIDPEVVDYRFVDDKAIIFIMGDAQNYEHRLSANERNLVNRFKNIKHEKALKDAYLTLPITFTYKSYIITHPVIYKAHRVKDYKIENNQTIIFTLSDGQQYKHILPEGEGLKQNGAKDVPFTYEKHQITHTVTYKAYTVTNYKIEDNQTVIFTMSDEQQHKHILPEGRGFKPNETTNVSFIYDNHQITSVVTYKAYTVTNHTILSNTEVEFTISNQAAAVKVTFDNYPLVVNQERLVMFNYENHHITHTMAYKLYTVKDYKILSNKIIIFTISNDQEHKHTFPEGEELKQDEATNVTFTYDNHQITHLVIYKAYTVKGYKIVDNKITIFMMNDGKDYPYRLSATEERSVNQFKNVALTLPVTFIYKNHIIKYQVTYKGYTVKDYKIVDNKTVIFTMSNNQGYEHALPEGESFEQNVARPVIFTYDNHQIKVHPVVYKAHTVKDYKILSTTEVEFTMGDQAKSVKFISSVNSPFVVNQVRPVSFIYDKHQITQPVMYKAHTVTNYKIKDNQTVIFIMSDEQGHEHTLPKEEELRKNEARNVTFTYDNHQITHRVMYKTYVVTDYKILSNTEVEFTINDSQKKRYILPEEEELKQDKAKDVTFIYDNHQITHPVIYKAHTINNYGIENNRTIVFTINDEQEHKHTLPEGEELKQDKAKDVTFIYDNHQITIHQVTYKVYTVRDYRIEDNRTVIFTMSDEQQHKHILPKGKEFKQGEVKIVTFTYDNHKFIHRVTYKAYAVKNYKIVDNQTVIFIMSDGKDYGYTWLEEEFKQNVVRPIIFTYDKHRITCRVTYKAHRVKDYKIVDNQTIIFTMSDGRDHLYRLSTVEERSINQLKNIVITIPVTFIYDRHQITHAVTYRIHTVKDHKIVDNQTVIFTMSNDQDYKHTLPKGKELKQNGAKPVTFTYDNYQITHQVAYKAYMVKDHKIVDNQTVIFIMSDKQEKRNILTVGEELEQNIARLVTFIYDNHQITHQVTYKAHTVKGYKIVDNKTVIFTMSDNHDYKHTLSRGKELKKNKAEDVTFTYDNHQITYAVTYKGYTARGYKIEDNQTIIFTMDEGEDYPYILPLEEGFERNIAKDVTFTYNNHQITHRVMYRAHTVKDYRIGDNQTIIFTMSDGKDYPYTLPKGKEFKQDEAKDVTFIYDNHKITIHQVTYKAYTIKDYKIEDNRTVIFTMSDDQEYKHTLSRGKELKQNGVKPITFIYDNHQITHQVMYKAYMVKDHKIEDNQTVVFIMSDGKDYPYTWVEGEELERNIARLVTFIYDNHQITYQVTYKAHTVKDYKIESSKTIIFLMGNDQEHRHTLPEGERFERNVVRPVTFIYDKHKITIQQVTYKAHAVKSYTVFSHTRVKFTMSDGKDYLYIWLAGEELEQNIARLVTFIYDNHQITYRVTYKAHTVKDCKINNNQTVIFTMSDDQEYKHTLPEGEEFERNVAKDVTFIYDNHQITHRVTYKAHTVKDYKIGDNQTVIFTMNDDQDYKCTLPKGKELKQNGAKPITFTYDNHQIIYAIVYKAYTITDYRIEDNQTVIFAMSDGKDYPYTFPEGEKLEQNMARPVTFIYDKHKITHQVTYKAHVVKDYRIKDNQTVIFTMSDDQDYKCTLPKGKELKQNGAKPITFTYDNHQIIYIVVYKAYTITDYRIEDNQTVIFTMSDGKDYPYKWLEGEEIERNIARPVIFIYDNHQITHRVTYKAHVVTDYRIEDNQTVIFTMSDGKDYPYTFPEGGKLEQNMARPVTFIYDKHQITHRVTYKAHTVKDYKIEDNQTIIFIMSSDQEHKHILPEWEELKQNEAKDVTFTYDNHQITMQQVIYKAYAIKGYTIFSNTQVEFMMSDGKYHLFTLPEGKEFERNVEGSITFTYDNHQITHQVAYKAHTVKDYKIKDDKTVIFTMGNNQKYERTFPEGGEFEQNTARPVTFIYDNHQITHRVTYKAHVVKDYKIEDNQTIIFIMSNDQEYKHILPKWEELKQNEAKDVTFIYDNHQITHQVTYKAHTVTDYRIGDNQTIIFMMSDGKDYPYTWLEGERLERNIARPVTFTYDNHQITIHQVTYKAHTVTDYRIEDNQTIIFTMSDGKDYPYTWLEGERLERNIARPVIFIYDKHQIIHAVTYKAHAVKDYKIIDNKTIIFTISDNQEHKHTLSKGKELRRNIAKLVTFAYDNHQITHRVIYKAYAVKNYKIENNQTIIFTMSDDQQHKYTLPEREELERDVTRPVIFTYDRHQITHRVTYKAYMVKDYKIEDNQTIIFTMSDNKSYPYTRLGGKEFKQDEVKDITFIYDKHQITHQMVYRAHTVKDYRIEDNRTVMFTMSDGKDYPYTRLGGKEFKQDEVKDITFIYDRHQITHRVAYKAHTVKDYKIIDNQTIIFMMSDGKDYPYTWLEGEEFEQNMARPVTFIYDKHQITHRVTYKAHTVKDYKIIDNKTIIFTISDDQEHKHILSKGKELRRNVAKPITFTYDNHQITHQVVYKAYTVKNYKIENNKMIILTMADDQEHKCIFSGGKELKQNLAKLTTFTYNNYQIMQRVMYKAHMVKSYNIEDNKTIIFAMSDGKYYLYRLSATEKISVNQLKKTALTLTITFIYDKHQITHQVTYKKHTVKDYKIIDNRTIIFTISDDQDYKHTLPKGKEFKQNVARSVTFTYDSHQITHRVVYKAHTVKNYNIEDNKTIIFTMSDGQDYRYRLLPAEEISVNQTKKTTLTLPVMFTYDNHQIIHRVAYKAFAVTNAHTDSMQTKPTIGNSRGYTKTLTQPIMSGEAKPTIFADLQNHSWASKSIEFLYLEGIIIGTAADKFSPAAKVTYGEITTSLQRLFDFNPQQGFFKKLVSKLKQKQFLTRQDVMVMMYDAMIASEMKLKAEKSEVLKRYIDADKLRSDAKAAVASLVAQGIISNKTSRLRPTQYASRAEVAVFLRRVYDLKRVYDKKNDDYLT